MINIDERTNISLFAVLCCIPFVVGAILWLSAVDQKASAANSKLDELSNVKELIQDVRERVIRIEQRQSDSDHHVKPH